MEQKLVEAVKECSELGHVQRNHRASSHHQLRRPLLRDPHQALAVTGQQLVTSLRGEQVTLHMISAPKHRIVTFLDETIILLLPNF